MKDNTQLTLTVLCTSYNQVNYIRECLDGIVMQRCSYNWEAIVHDDASTDGTQDIIREYAQRYPDIIKPILQTENQYSKKDGSLRRILMNACKGKYIANLEGDDYWTDPYKLQKQIDYLESHPECGLVRTDFDRYYQSENKLEQGMFDGMHGMTDTMQDYLLNARFAGPCTWVYRADIDKNRVLLPTKEYFNGDLTLLLEMCRCSTIKFLPDNTAVYRILDNSASHIASPIKAIDFLNRLKNTRILYAKNEPLLFKLKLWYCICRSYRYKYIDANIYRKWIPMCISDFLKLFIYPTKYL